LARSKSFDAIIVGAGFAGLYMLHRLLALGYSVQVLEAGADVGGTWYWNRYPGARCDVESVEYSYSFSEEIQQDWEWTERYATQPEILKYIQFVADRLSLRPHIELNTRVATATFSPASGCWTVYSDKGEYTHCRYFIAATGCLSSAKLPEIEGLEVFRGQTYHTGAWPHEAPNFANKAVGVIGTGSSAMQLVPEVARQAEQLFVFQRTANYAIPARNEPLQPETVRLLKKDYAAFRRRARESPSGVNHFMVPTRSALSVSLSERRDAYEERWRVGGAGLTRAFNDILTDEAANRTAADFVREKIREIVKNPAVAKALAPGYLIGTKRLGTETGYYEAFNRKNVSLVDIRATPITAVTPTGLMTADRTFEFDALIFATGFDAMTGSLLAMDIQVEDGVALKDLWSHGPRSYLGIMIAGLPNFFTITGPGSPSVLSNVIVSIEQHVDWIADCLSFMKARGLSQVQPQQAAQDSWMEHVDQVASATLLPRGTSWYLGANVPGKPRVFMPYAGGVGVYRRKCQEIAEAGYSGFDFLAEHKQARQEFGS
jgi:cyclohexanone monooxygenase